MDYYYLATGKVRLGNCADYILTQNYLLAFGIGSIVYIKQQASKGKMEKICIKKATIVDQSTPYRGIVGVINYVDTFNRVWLESELISESGAIDLAINYYEELQVKLGNLALTCSQG